ncbi:metallophosphoesterase [Gordonia malaquae]|uniref:metallophosphoesterase n=1 Tax=Gordonia malaquae TaxID=410332 RepID=UPI0030193156
MSDSTGDPTAVVFGDWHGNEVYARSALAMTSRVQTEALRIHVGDFGLWPDAPGHHYLASIDREARRQGILLHVVPGNHEGWSHLSVGAAEFGLDGFDDDGFMTSRLYPALRIAPRWAIWERRGTTYACLSGAASIDFQQRVAGHNWWPEEMPTQRDVDDLVDAATGRRIDVFVTHDAPSAAIDGLGLYSGRPSGWSAAALAYARQSSDLIEQASARLVPTLHLCGHHHVRRTARVEGTLVQILGDDGTSLAMNRTLLSGSTMLD